MAMDDNRVRDRTHIACAPCSWNAVALQARSNDLRTVVDSDRTLIRSTRIERTVQTVYT